MRHPERPQRPVLQPLRGLLTGEPRQYNNTAVNQGGAQGPYGGAAQQGSGYGAYPPPHTGFGGTVPPFAFDPMGGVSPAEVLDTGVSFGTPPSWSSRTPPTTCRIPLYEADRQEQV